MVFQLLNFRHMKKILFSVLFLLSGFALSAQTLGNSTTIPAISGDTSFRTSLLNLKNWLALAGGGTVTSVAISAPTSVFDVSGSPVTSSGTLALSFDNQSANTVFAGPSSGGATTPGFRALTASDIPTIAASQVTGANLTAASSKVSVTGGTGAVLNAATVDVVPGNITITDLAGTLTVAKGGTGLTSVGSDGTVLGSNGTANVYLTPTVTTTAAAIAFSRNANSLELNLPNADASNRGTVSTGTQTFAGAKTFNALLTGGAGVVGTATTTQAALSAQGVFASDYESTTSNLTMDEGNNFLEIPTLSASITIALPACNATRNKWEFTIYKAGTDNFLVTVDPNGTETIGGSTTKVLAGQYTTLHCKCINGTGWTSSTR